MKLTSHGVMVWSVVLGPALLAVVVGVVVLQLASQMVTVLYESLE